MRKGYLIRFYNPIIAICGVFNQAHVKIQSNEE